MNIKYCPICNDQLQFNYMDPPHTAFCGNSNIVHYLYYEDGSPEVCEVFYYDDGYKIQRYFDTSNQKLTRLYFYYQNKQMPIFDERFDIEMPINFEFNPLHSQNLINRIKMMVTFL